MTNEKYYDRFHFVIEDIHGNILARDLQPQNANEVPRPQSPMGSSVDASVGRAANLPFFPGQ